MELFVRYALELSILFPAAAFALLPVRRGLRFSAWRTYAAAGGLLLCLVLAGAWMGAAWGWRVRTLLIPGSALLFLAYCRTVDMSLTRKLFCACNAAMLCAFCFMYAVFLMAPVELKSGVLSMDGPFALQSGGACLGMTILLGVVFSHALIAELPALLEEEHLGAIWKLLFWIPLFTALLTYWRAPKWPIVAMTGRVRIVSLVEGWLFPLLMLLAYHVLWRTAERLKANARLQQENTVLQMENKRYGALRQHIEEVRALRHDFRQHLLVIDRYLDSGQTAALRDYLNQIKENASRKYANYCGNGAVDAVAAHYAALAGEQGIAVEWKLDLPDALPVRESDYCAILGNLLENALKAVANLPEPRRRIKVISSAMSDSMLGLTVDNPFEGELTFGGNGFPRSARGKGGLGLLSVSNTVRRYGGFMDIKTEDNVFSVEILMYGNEYRNKEEIV